jgi:hypothetical protein
MAVWRQSELGLDGYPGYAFVSREPRCRLQIASLEAPAPLIFTHRKTKRRLSRFTEMLQ